MTREYKRYIFSGNRFPCEVVTFVATDKVICHFPTIGIAGNNIIIINIAKFSYLVKLDSCMLKKYLNLQCNFVIKLISLFFRILIQVLQASVIYFTQYRVIIL